MSEATCAVLAAIFPLVLATSVLERRSPHPRIRRHPFYRIVFLGTFVAALGGTVYAVIGVQVHGFPGAAGLAMWILFGVAIVGLGIALIASIATMEIEEDDRPRKRKHGSK